MLAYHKIFKKIQHYIIINKRENVLSGDILFIFLIFLLSSLLFLFNLGFYSTDWTILSWSRISEDLSFHRIYNLLNNDQVKGQPGNTLYLSFLFWIFKDNPIGYHLVNSLILVLINCLIYLALRQLKVERVLSLSIVTLFILLPHYSTTRFWIQTFSLNLSILLFFLSLYAEFRFKTIFIKRRFLWKFYSMLFMLLAVLVDNLILPAFIIPIIIIIYQEYKYKRYQKINAHFRNINIEKPKNYLFLNISLWFFLLIIRTLLNNWDNNITQIPSKLFWETLWILSRIFNYKYQFYDWGINYIAVIDVFLFQYVIKLPLIIFKIILLYFNIKILIFATLVGILVHKYLKNRLPDSNKQFIKRETMVSFIQIGIILILIGFSLYFFEYGIQFSTTGIANQRALYPSVGMAIFLVGLIGWLSSFFFLELERRKVFLIIFSIVCGVYFIILNTIASFWIESYKTQLKIISEVKKVLPTMQPGTTLLLDGSCPYNGPAIVFESNWDLTGALILQYGHYDIKADVISHKSRVSTEGISTSIYGKETLYNYNSLVIFNFKQQQAYEIKNISEAQEYFKKNPTSSNFSSCPPGREQFGVKIF